MIISRTPFRISFFGGGTDYPAWYLENGGKVLSTSIDKYCYISIRYLPTFFDHKYRIVYSKIENVKHIDEIVHPAVREILRYHQCYRGVEIHHDGDLPARAGLGSSSSFAVGLLNAVNGLKREYSSSEELAKVAIHIEQDLICENVGSQDQIAAAYGGLNEIHFFQDGSFDVSPVVITAKRKQELNDHLLLVFSGLSRFSSEIAKTQIENFHCRKQQLVDMGNMVDEGVGILRDDNRPICEFGELMNEAWQKKKSLSDKVSTPEINQIYDKAIKSGAVGGKVLGAGGGGFVLFFVEPDKRESVKKALDNLTQVPFNFDSTGSKIIVYQPEDTIHQ